MSLSWAETVGVGVAMVAAAAWLGWRGSTNHAPWASICHTTSMPPSTRPKTTWWPSSHGVSWVVMKNCEPLVSGPALAIESVPAPPCLIAKLSSANLGLGFGRGLGFGLGLGLG